MRVTKSILQSLKADESLRVSSVITVSLLLVAALFFTVRAATTVFSTHEAENGTRSTNTVTIMDSSASGGSAIRFSQSTPQGPALPMLGFSLNGESLSGPLQQVHYNTLGGFTPAPVWARLGFSSDGNWQQSVNTYVGAARAAGMKLLLRASFTNAVWSGSQPLDAAHQAAYGDFVRDLAIYARDTMGLTADDVVFEHPNEMNGRVSGAAYAGAAANAYAKLKSVNPNYKIIGASENVYASNWQTWLQDVYAAGYAQASDGISFHNYDAQGQAGKYTFLKNLMQQYNHWPAMVWLTEFGATTPPGATGNGSPGAGIGGQTEAGQTVRLVGVLESLRDEYPWITHAFIYADEDIPSRKSSDPFEAYFGIYRNDSNGTITGAKPAVSAIQQLYAP